MTPVRVSGTRFSVYQDQWFCLQIMLLKEASSLGHIKNVAVEYAISIYSLVYKQTISVQTLCINYVTISKWISFWAYFDLSQPETQLRDLGQNIYIVIEKLLQFFTWAPIQLSFFTRICMYFAKSVLLIAIKKTVIVIIRTDTSLFTITASYININM